MCLPNFMKFLHSSLPFQDIEKPNCHRRSNGRMDNVKTVYLVRVCGWGRGGGYKYSKRLIFL